MKEKLKPTSIVAFIVGLTVTAVMVVNRPARRTLDLVIESPTVAVGDNERAVEQSSCPANPAPISDDEKPTQMAPIEKFCPRLSREEEDELLVGSGRSPDVLGALALLQSPRSAEFADEALSKNPDHIPALWAAAFLKDNLSKRLAQAEHLCSLLPNEAAAFIATAVLSAYTKNQDKAKGYLKLAAKQPLFQSRNERWGI